MNASTKLPGSPVRAIALALLVSACSEPPFAHTNPLDPEFVASYVLTGGTDTLSHWYASFPMHVEGTPPLAPEIRILWSTDHPRLHVDGIGSVFAEPTLQPTLGTITATIGSNFATRSFVMLQRAASIVTTCRTSTPCDTVNAIGSQFAFSVSGTDSFGRALVDVPFALSAQPSIVRDPSVLAPVDVIEADRRRFASLTNGSTWVTIDLGAYRDSVRVVVRQRATSWTNICPATVAVGETANLRVLDFVDGNGVPLDIGAVGSPVIEWTPGQPFTIGASASVDTSGAITGVASGMWQTRSFIPGFGESIACNITIVGP